MSNIYSAKFMHEATTTLERKVFKRPVNETYLFSAIKSLNEMNAMIDEKTKKLYIQINEAESKEAENKLFAEYFYQFKSIFESFAHKIQEMKSRMVISIENKVETWEDLYKDDSYISAFDKEFSYSGYNFFHVTEANYPRLHLQKYYQKEFDYIGQLMQDTSMSASPSVRLKIIASVCNNFANCSGDKNWIKELIHDMVDIDDKEINKSYSECIYNSLRDKYDITVDKSTLYTCKESLMDYEDIIDAACKLCDNLLYELNKVAENISSFLFRNQDNKLKIKTDTDGIIDRDYRLDTYSMNQLDLFMKNKINQIRKLLNVYCTAVGIKFDTAVDYIDQNIEILKMAKTYDSNQPGGEEDEEDNDSIDDVRDGEDSGEESEPEDKPEDGDDDDFRFGEEDDDFDDYDDEEPIEEEPEDDDFGDLEDGSETPQNNDVVDKDTEDFNEAYLFESELFELEMMWNEYEMHRAITEAVLLEADKKEEVNVRQAASYDNSAAAAETDAEEAKAKAGDAKQGDQKNDMQNVKKLASQTKDPNFFQKILAKIKELWQKFLAKFDNTKKQIEYLKKNEKYLKTPVTNNATLKYTPNFGLLDNIKIIDLNYTDTSLQQALDNADDFYVKCLPQIFTNDDKGGNITDVIKTKVLGQAQEEKPANELKPTIQEAFDFCTKKYEPLVNSIRNQMGMLDRAEKVAKDISKVDGATVPTAESYFMEFSGDKTTTDSTKSARIKTYFNCCSRILAAKMTVCHNLFNEMYAYCNWYISIARGGGSAQAPAPADNNQQNQNQGQNPQQPAQGQGK